MKRRTEITIETDRVMVFEQRTSVGFQTWCAACAREVRLVSVFEARVMAGVDAAAVVAHRRAQNNAPHTRYSTPEALLVCPNSIPT